MDASDLSANCEPLGALLYASDALPDIEALIDASSRCGGFAVTHVAPAGEGWAEILRDGLTFDLRGLRDGGAVAAPFVKHFVGFDPGKLVGLSALVLSPGPHLAGAQALLPVIRVAAGLMLQLARIGDPHAVCWIPAKNALSPALFAKAVLPWLDGGPFPALALAAIKPKDDESLESDGLKFLIGQEFYLTSQTGSGQEQTTRAAIRLIDWLVAHGPVTRAVTATLAGTGEVFLEAQDSTRIVARCA